MKFRRKKDNARKYHPKMDVVPGRYPKQVKSYLTILKPGGGSQTIEVQEISAEIIQLPDKTELYTGVSPDILDFRGGLPFLKTWKQKRMHYAKFGYPYTYNPRTGEFFNSEKKKRILVERGVGQFLTVDDKTVFLLLDYTKKVPTPLWREGVTKDDKVKWESMNDMRRWVQNQKNVLDLLEHDKLAYYTDEDITSIEIMRAEMFQLVESKGIEKTIKAMEKIGTGMDMLWYFLIFGGTLFLMMLMVFYFADQGVFKDEIVAMRLLL